jgi:hypothetical protein
LGRQRDRKPLVDAQHRRRSCQEANDAYKAAVDASAAASEAGGPEAGEIVVQLDFAALREDCAKAEAKRNSQVAKIWCLYFTGLALLDLDATEAAHQRELLGSMMRRQQEMAKELARVKADHAKDHEALKRAQSIIDGESRGPPREPRGTTRVAIPKFSGDKGSTDAITWLGQFGRYANLLR